MPRSAFTPSEPTLFFDENVSDRVVRALRALGHDVVHLLDEFERGTPDVQFLPAIGDKGWFLVTQDKRIRSRPHERRALLNAGVGAFVFTGRAEKSTDEQAILILKHLPRIKGLAAKTERPFIFGISDRGNFDRLT